MISDLNWIKHKSALINTDDSLRIIYPFNMNLVNIFYTDPVFQEVCKADCCLSVDGKVLQWLLKYKYKINADKISGSDLIFELHDFFENTDCNNLFLIGGDQDVNEKACMRLSKFYGQNVFGFSPKYFEREMQDMLQFLQLIERHKPKILYVCFGAPKQEKWIFENKKILEKAGLRYVIAGGGTLDLVSQRFVRAPKFVQEIGLEWLFRTVSSPTRSRILNMISSFQGLKRELFK